MPINLRNNRSRDAKVGLESVTSKKKVRYVDGNGNEVMPIRLLKCDLGHNYDSLLRTYQNTDRLFTELIGSDVEVDLELFGKYLTETTRVYVCDDHVVFHVDEIEVILNPDGSERERKPLRVEPQNINTDIPLVWSGRYIEKGVAVRRFVFASTKQIVHVNGLTYDFLYEIASDLHQRNSCLLLGAGAKGEKPLVLQRGGRNFRGFLEGRVDGTKYCLLLHLSDMELKIPAAFEEEL